MLWQMPNQTRKTDSPTLDKADLDDWDFRGYLLQEIETNGGWVNCHTHLDRAYTISVNEVDLGNLSLHQKWKQVDEVKKNSSVNQIYDRMAYAIERQLEQGVTVLGSFLDVDEVIKDKSIKAAAKIKNTFDDHDLDIFFCNQTLKGVLSETAKKWFLEAVEFVDIVGSLPGADQWFEEEHLDLVLEEAKRRGKLVHVHVDQLNTVREKETEILAKKTVEHGMEGRVALIHGVSLAAQPYEYRRKVYRLMRKAKLMVITCPTAWIDATRSEFEAPTHNAIAPVDELVDAGFIVSLGTDNIADVYKPFTDGNMWTELRFLLETCHYYNLEELIKISTINGRKVMGLETTEK